MNGKWILLKDAVCAVALRVGAAEKAEQEILRRLKWGEISACAESYQDAWIHRADSINRKAGTNGYREVRRAPRHMIPIAPDWWGYCEIDFVQSTAHVRWSAEDIAKIGNVQPFHILVDGVLLAALDVERLWPVGKTKMIPKRPVGTGLQDADLPLIDQMHAYMIEKNIRSPTDAANKLFNRGVNIPGAGKPESKVSRLVRRYKAKFLKT